MAIVSLGAELYQPMWPSDISSIPSLANAYTVNTLASQQIVAVAFEAPKTGNITGASIRFHAAANATGIVYTLRPLGATGLPDMNTSLASVTVGTVSSAGFAAATFSSPYAATRGEGLAICVTTTSGTIDYQFGSFADAGLFGSSSIIRSQDSGATWTMVFGLAPSAAIIYDDGYTAVPGMWPIDFVASGVMNNLSNPDTKGNRFNLPYDARVGGYWVWADIESDCLLRLFDASGVVSGSSYTLVDDYPQGTTGVLSSHYLPAPLTLAKNTDYVLALTPQTNTSSPIYTIGSSTADLFGAIPGKGSAVAVTADEPTNLASFTNDDNRLMMFGLIIDGIDVGSGEGGGGGAVETLSFYVS